TNASYSRHGGAAYFHRRTTTSRLGIPDGISPLCARIRRRPRLCHFRRSKSREEAKVFFIDEDQTVWPDVADALAAAAAEAGTVLLWSDEDGRFNATYSPDGSCVLTASWDEG